MSDRHGGRVVVSRAGAGWWRSLHNEQPMDDHLGVSVGGAVRRTAPLSTGVRARSWWAWLASHWELLVAVFAVAAAVVAFWVTLDAHFLKYPAWLAVLKADFILGPIGVGLYWRYRRPHNRLGLLLIGLGVVGVVYILQSSTVPVLFGIGLLCEPVIFVGLVVVSLAFPSGRLDGLIPRLIAWVTLIGVGGSSLIFSLTQPSLVPSLPISACRTVCPANGLAVWSSPSWTSAVTHFQEIVGIAAGLAAAAVLVWRFATGTPRRRRALAIGAPLALVFLLVGAAYWTKLLLTPGSGSPGKEPLGGVLNWTYAAAPSLLWYGFLFALIAAELYAGRVLRRLNRDFLGRPSLGELEGMLRGPLGDPGLALGFWRSERSDWVDAEGAPLAGSSSHQDVTEIDRDGRAVIAIIHDAQLSEDPELLQAAGAVALLTLENAELGAGRKRAVQQLRDSRARITRAGDRERRKLERDLHDGAQQRLLGALLRLSMADELADGNSELHNRLERAGAEVQHAIDELRELAHGIYPAVLANSGIEGAIRALARRAPGSVTITLLHAGKYPAEVETAFYYCCLEAVQNATKHAGEGTPITIRLTDTDHELHLEVHDDGPGFDPDEARDGIGLENMRDRLGAVGGHITITSSPGAGTTVTATVPAHAIKPSGSVA